MVKFWRYDIYFRCPVDNDVINYSSCTRSGRSELQRVRLWFWYRSCCDQAKSWIDVVQIRTRHIQVPHNKIWQSVENFFQLFFRHIIIPTLKMSHCNLRFI